MGPAQGHRQRRESVRETRTGPPQEAGAASHAQKVRGRCAPSHQSACQAAHRVLTSPLRPTKHTTGPQAPRAPSPSNSPTKLYLKVSLRSPRALEKRHFRVSVCVRQKTREEAMLRRARRPSQRHRPSPEDAHGGLAARGARGAIHLRRCCFPLRPSPQAQRSGECRLACRLLRETSGWWHHARATCVNGSCTESGCPALSLS